jgi:hypothetical protein
MTNLIYASQEHKTILDIYVAMCIEFADEVSTKSKFNNYKDVTSVIFDYHNSYGEGTREDNFYNWLMIIPINLSVATNGFFAGIETKSNRSIIRAYKVVLEEMLQETVNRLDDIKTTDD